MAEYWMEAIERIMDDLDFTPEQKLKATVSLLRDEVYKWWLTQKSFEKLKTVLTEAPVLVQPEPGKEFTVYSDASHYHPDQSNEVADALSHRVMTDLRAMFTRLSLFDDGSLLAELQAKNGGTTDFGINSDWVLCFYGRICVPNDEDLRQLILREAHDSPYTMHPSGNKMYRDLWELYWWPGLKREVTDFVARYLTCQQAKIEHQLPSSLLQPVKIPL
ncbi:uncharacterized protein LOC128043032 [Gossypium raimondii]|uniref:uncharacterized protein LOC128043032 n=1 Tax=Gossypium raimondii TaxID=29730 RepID=UPI00227B98E5|nr:uncharacterized protein LOC128043032 [Gossypium raimondii]